MPPGPGQSKSVTRAEHADGTSEITEFLRDGGYRVTHCNRDGSLRISQTVSPIPDPDGGTTLVPASSEEPDVNVAAVYGDASDPVWAANFRATRPARNATVIAPTSKRPTSMAGPAPPAAQPRGAFGAINVAGDACTNGQYNYWQSAWTGRSYNYYVNRSRFAYNDTITAALVAGHLAWDRTSNDCGFGDITNLNSYYIGSTAATVHTAPDGVSTIDKGDLTGLDCSGALACTWLFHSASGASSEADTRFSDALTWSTAGASGAYDYRAVATHESGHAIGLDHANSSSALTMFHTMGTGSTEARTLARGDVLGMRARYP